MTYSEKLKDPRWQKKRLEIFQRDNWTCQDCKSTKNTLVAHHEKYSGEPWDIENEHLITICEKCHESRHFETSNESLVLKGIGMFLDLDRDSRQIKIEYIDKKTDKVLSGVVIKNITVIDKIIEAIMDFMNVK